MRDNPNARRQRGIRDPNQRACDIADRKSLAANCTVWIEVWLDTYDQMMFEFGWKL